MILGTVLVLFVKNDSVIEMLMSESAMFGFV